MSKDYVIDYTKEGIYINISDLIQSVDIEVVNKEKLISIDFDHKSKPVIVLLGAKFYICKDTETKACEDNSKCSKKSKGCVFLFLINQLKKNKITNCFKRLSIELIEDKRLCYELLISKDYYELGIEYE